MNSIYVPNSVIIKYGRDIPNWLWNNVWDSDWRWGEHDAFGQFMNLTKDADAIMFRLRFGV